MADQDFKLIVNRQARTAIDANTRQDALCYDSDNDILTLRAASVLKTFMTMDSNEFISRPIKLSDGNTLGLGSGKATLTFTDAATDTLGLTNSYFGVGTNSPSELIDIVDSSADSEPALRIANDAQAVSIGVDGSSSDLFTIWAGNPSDDLPRFAFDTSAGKLGIGGTAVTTGPSKFLEIIQPSTGSSTDSPTQLLIGRDGGTNAGVLASSIQLGLSTATTDSCTIGYVHGSAGDERMAFFVEADEKATIKTSGNMGLGESAPTSGFGWSGTTLHIKGTEPTIRLDSTGAGAGDWEMGIDAAVDRFNIAKIGGNRVFVIDSSEQVGIGFITPSAKLSVQSSATGLISDFGYTAAGQRLGIYVSGTSSDLKVIGSNDLGLYESGGTGLTVKNSSGDIGIGTTGPDEKLHVYDSTDNVVVRVEGIASGKRGIFEGHGNPTDGNSVTNFVAYHYNAGTPTPVGSISYLRDSEINSGKLSIDVYDTGVANTALTILKDGKVGIGTAAPYTSASNKLTVDGTISLKDEHYLMWGDGARNSIHCDVDQYMKFYVNNINTMCFDNAGRIGIGTTTPDEKVEVDGNVLLSNNQSLMIVNAAGSAKRDIAKLDGSDVLTFGSTAITDVYLRSSTKYIRGTSNGFAIDTTPVSGFSLVTSSSIRCTDIKALTGQDVSTSGKVDIARGGTETIGTIPSGYDYVEMVVSVRRDSGAGDVRDELITLEYKNDESGATITVLSTIVIYTDSWSYGSLVFSLSGSNVQLNYTGPVVGSSCDSSNTHVVRKYEFNVPA